MKRRIILIDAENFNGGPIATPVQARWCRRTLDNWIAPTDNDHVVIAVDESCITNVHAAWSHTRLLGGHRAQWSRLSTAGGHGRKPPAPL
ncbi:hypothetical protein CIP101841_00103 [Corynebacterium diphtheriae]|nr:hypothetical protein CIP101841_00103 [Corynebacterium diphtheriae]